LERRQSSADVPLQNVVCGWVEVVLGVF